MELPVEKGANTQLLTVGVHNLFYESTNATSLLKNQKCIHLCEKEKLK